MNDIHNVHEFLRTLLKFMFRLDNNNSHATITFTPDSKDSSVNGLIQASKSLIHLMNIQPCAQCKQSRAFYIHKITNEQIQLCTSLNTTTKEHSCCCCYF